MTTSQRVEYAFDNAIATLRLHRAPVDAIDHPMIVAIHVAPRPIPTYA